jgi:phosphate acyltransferase
MALKQVKIGIDVMGGENAPNAILEGISKACEKDKQLFFLLFGNEKIVNPIFKNYPILETRCELIHTTHIISNKEKPVDALRKSKNTSMRQVIEAVKNQNVDACISCGNTGALMVLSKLILGCIEGIKRPAIIGTLPSPNGLTIMLDLGANVDCNKTHLFQFALMGDCFAKILLHKKRPTIGLLNIGSEDIKGRIVEQEAASLIKSEEELNFIGYVEGDEILSGKVDVVVTDGFAGNIALKAIEGTARLLLHKIKESIKQSFVAQIGSIFTKKAVKKSMSFMNPSHYNGAMLIGLNGIVVKSHGSSKKEDVENAINVAAELARNEINNKIFEELKISEEHHPKSSIDKLVDKISDYINN